MSGAELDGAMDTEAWMQRIMQIGDLATQKMGEDFMNHLPDEVPQGATGNLLTSIQPTSIEAYQWIIDSDLSYAEPVHEGREVMGPFFSELQRRWWFWTLDNVYGGSYEPIVGTGNKTQGNKFMDRTLDYVEGNMETYIEMAEEELDL